MNLLQGGWKEQGPWTLGMNQTLRTGMCWRILLASMSGELWEKHFIPQRAVPSPSAQLWTHFKLSLRRARQVHSFLCFPPGKEMQTQSWQSRVVLLLAEWDPAPLAMSHDWRVLWVVRANAGRKPRRFAKGKVVQLKEPRVAPNLIFKVLLRRHVFLFTWKLLCVCCVVEKCRVWDVKASSYKIHSLGKTIIP